MRARLALASMAVLAAVCGCAATPGPAPANAPTPATPAATANELRLQVGQSASVDDAGFKVTFEAVVGDSRCPKGAQCIWAGSAAVRLSVAGTSGTATFALHTAPGAGPNAAAYEGWAIRLVSLEPYPVDGREIAPGSYVATLGIEHGDAGLPTQ
jgi:hypothetical protein